MGFVGTFEHSYICVLLVCLVSFPLHQSLIQTLPAWTFYNFSLHLEHACLPSQYKTLAFIGCTCYKGIAFTWFKKMTPWYSYLCMYHISLGIIEPRDLELTCTDLLLTKKWWICMSEAWSTYLALALQHMDTPRFLEVLGMPKLLRMNLFL